MTGTEKGNQNEKNRKDKPMENVKNKEQIKALKNAEKALGENLVWLSDAFDLRIRQGDKETLRRLDQLNAAWTEICLVLNK